MYPVTAQVCEVITHRILPLCQHERVTGAQEPEAAAAQQLPWCEMTFSGEAPAPEALLLTARLCRGVVSGIHAHSLCLPLSDHAHIV